MAKKKKQETQEEEPTSNLKALIHDHSLFFDRLVDLIPPRFYLSTNDEEDRPWYPGLSKAQRAAAKKQTRENTKKSRRARLDPEKSSTTLDVLKERAEAQKPIKEENDAMAMNRSITYEELRERLHKRLEELRSTRNTRPESRRNGQLKDKRKRDDKPREDEIGSDSKKQKKGMEEKSPAVVDLSFGHVKLGDANQSIDRKKKKKKLSKEQELEKVKRIEEKKKDPEKGDKISKKYSWKAAVDRASGVKVHDDPKLLKESIKKEKKKRQKSAQKWKERAETREKQMAEKQKKRSDNIKERIHQTKMKKIEKREKKLMRPGFEGRKEGFVNTGST